MTTPRRSNLSQERSVVDLQVDTRVTRKGGKSWWRMPSEKQPKAAKKHDSDTAKPKVKLLDYSHTGADKKVDIVGCNNGSVEVVSRKSTRNLKQRRNKSTTTHKEARPMVSKYKTMRLMFTTI